MQLKTLLFNMQDFYLFLEKGKSINLSELTEIKWQLLSPSLFPNKPLEKTLKIAQLIRDRDPDLLMMIEVGGRDSLENFNQHFLNNEYEIFHSDSNSDRGIDTGYMVKKELLNKYQFKFTPHTNIVLNNGKRPSRGFFQLDICDLNNKCLLSLLLTHLKSKLDLKKQDFEGRNQRMAEVDFLVKFYQKNQKKWPLAIAGDLNGIIAGDDTEPELLPLTKVGLTDVLEWQKTPPEQRATYIYFAHGHKRVPMQLDYILVPSNRADQICLPDSAQVVDTFYLSESTRGDLTAPDQRKELVSDHFPLEVVFLLKD